VHRADLGHPDRGALEAGLLDELPGVLARRVLEDAPRGRPAGLGGPPPGEVAVDRLADRPGISWVSRSVAATTTLPAGSRLQR